MSPQVRKSGFRNSEHFCLWNPESGKILPMESAILGFRIRNTSQGVRNPSNDWNPESKLTDKCWNPERGIQNPRLSWIPLHWGAIYELSRMLMKRNVNNDVRKDSTIEKLEFVMVA